MFELVRCEVVEARMRPDFIVMAAPGFDDHLRLASAAEPLEAQALVTEAAVEALVHAVLPRLTRIDQRRFDARLLQPFEDRFAHEFGAIIRAQVAWRTAFADQPRQHLDHALRTDAAGDVDGQALARELVDDCQTFQALPVGTGIEYEVIGPQEIGSGGRNGPRSGGCYTPSATASRQLQLRYAPQPMRTMPAHVKALPAQEDADAPIAIARILRGASWLQSSAHHAGSSPTRI